MKTQSRNLTNLPVFISKTFSLVFLFIAFSILSCQSSSEQANRKTDLAEQPEQGYTSETLEVHKITDQVYQYISFLETQSFGKVPCNGMVVIDSKEAIIFDTPTADQTSRELINWVEQSLGCRVKAVVATHFHEDCLGGLQAFQERGIPTYASHETIALAKTNQTAIPENGFETEMTLKVGNEKVQVLYPGNGHTYDNVVGYFPKAEALFGGCLIKEMGAGKGNLADADTLAWPQTVTKLKTLYPHVKHVVPGHGKPGGPELLDYTARLFGQE